MSANDTDDIGAYGHFRFNHVKDTLGIDRIIRLYILGAVSLGSIQS